MFLTKRKVRYYRPDDGTTAEDAYECDTTWSDEFPHRVAEDCADDYHSNHDGWECSWPIELVVLSQFANEPLGTFEIDRETTPVFYAHEVRLK